MTQVESTGHTTQVESTRDREIGGKHLKHKTGRKHRDTQTGRKDDTNGQDSIPLGRHRSLNRSIEPGGERKEWQGEGRTEGGGEEKKRKQRRMAAPTPLSSCPSRHTDSAGRVLAGTGTHIALADRRLWHPLGTKPTLPWPKKTAEGSEWQGKQERRFIDRQFVPARSTFPPLSLCPSPLRFVSLFSLSGQEKGGGLG